MIPVSVTRDQYLAAIQPLMDLLNVSANEVYSIPPMVFSLDSIDFTVVGDGTGVKATAHPQGDEFAELVYSVHVKIDRPKDSES